MEEIQITKMENVLEKAFSEGRASLTEAEVYSLLSSAGVRVPVHRILGVSDEICDLAEFDGDEVVLKIVSSKILHKSDVGGVKIVRKTKQDLSLAMQHMTTALKDKGLLGDLQGFMIVQKSVFTPGMGGEYLLSARSDEAFGALVGIGFGGVNTEFLAKWMKPSHSFLFFQADHVEIDPLHPVFAISLGGTRVQATLTKAEIERAMHSLAGIMKAFSKESGDKNDSRFCIEEIEINPAVCEGGKLIALDGVLKFSTQKIQKMQRPVEKIDFLLHPKSAVVLGVSATKTNPGRIILNNLKNGAGVSPDQLYVIHPKEEEIDGCKCVKNLCDLPKKVDLCVITVPAKSSDGWPAAEAIEELIEKDLCQSVILIPGGLGETQEGKEIQTRIEAMIQHSRKTPSQGPVVNGGNCLGIVSKPGGYNTFFIPEYKLPFSGGPVSNLACISQSGAWLVSQTSRIFGVIDPLYTISYGNQMDLTISDYLQYLKNHESIDVFSLYIEGLKPLDGMKLVEQVREICENKKSVVIYKSAKTAMGAKASASHTASVAGDYAVFRDLLTRAGAVVCESLDEFEDTSYLFASLSGRKKEGNRLMVVSNAGFECTVASDTLGGLSLSRLSPETVKNLEATIPAGLVDIHNPLDVTPMFSSRGYCDLVRIFREDDQMDALLLSIVPPSPAVETLAGGKGHREDIYREGSDAKILIHEISAWDRPVVVVVDSGELYDPFVNLLKQSGICVFRRIDRALLVLNAWFACK